MKKVLFYFLVLSQLVLCKIEAHQIDLSGKWTVKLDSTDIGIAEGWQGKLYDISMTLPGTTDDAGLGIPNTLQPELAKPQLLYLTRLNSYVGPAWYSKEIALPKEWKGKDILLYMERVLWDTKVWVDGKRIEGHEESLTTPHCYDLTDCVKPGKKHLLTVRVDNRKRHDVSNDLAHAYTDHTQIKWNGIIGEINLKAVEKVRIATIQLFPNIERKEVKAILSIVNKTSSAQRADLNLLVKAEKGVKNYPAHSQQVTIQPGNSVIETVYKMGNDITLWNEFTPELYKASASLKSGKMLSEVQESFGMRQIKNNGNKLMLNGKPLFLRGTLECCIFPLTGTPPMDKKGWYKVFNAAKEYGLNHLRFHSWCPPEAAFQVADEMGFYLQIELPAWVLTIGEDANAVQFLKNEADRIIQYYGNHPSFCLWSLGNELQGDFAVLSSMLTELKAKDTRHLYTTTSFTFEKGHGGWPEPNDDFFVTQWTDKGWVRGQGVFNQEAPSFDKDYVSQLEGMKVPLITHEIGQYSVYPDLTEIPKYTGVLKPLNFMAIKNDLEKKGLLHKAPDYLMASGKLAAILYKEEIERALKTAGISGFQLLDLHDFPGQGTALVGLLNAFWESKGIISGDHFRQFCSPVVPLLRFSKAIYKNNETFEGEIELYNYGGEVLNNRTISWEILDNGVAIKKGSFKVEAAQYGYNGALGTISFPLNEIRNASKLDVIVRADKTDYTNKWNIWVYPEKTEMNWGNVQYTRNYEEAMAMLAQGKKVLFNPDWKTIKGIEGKFVPVFWSPVHFPKQAGTMGLLCDPKHKAFKDFPTDSHTDWQWWDLIINSTTMITDSLQGGNPIVEMIDNFSNNRRLASLYEGKVGKGELVLATFDLESDLANRVTAQQMLVSLVNYMNSPEFNPATINNFESIKEMFGSTANKKESANSIY